MALVLLIASFVAASALAVRAGMRSENRSADGNGERIEAVGEFVSAVRSSGSSDGRPTGGAPGAQDGSVGADSEELSAGLSSRLSATPAQDGDTGLSSPTIGSAAISSEGRPPAGPSTSATLVVAVPSTTFTTSATTTSTTRPPPSTVLVVSLTNGGFDSSDIPDGGYLVLQNGQLPGWVSDSGVLEVWSGTKDDVGSIDGANVLELNSTGQDTIHQDFATRPGTTIRWTFFHRARSGKDKMEFLIGPSDGRLRSIKEVKTGRSWKQYSGSYDVPDGQTSTRIAFRSLESGSEGNLIDGVQVSLES